MTTFVLSCVRADLIPATVEATVFGLAFFYGGLVQLLAGMWEFARGNTFGAVAFSSYGAFWLSFWYLDTHPALLAAAKGDAHKGVGTYLLAWTIFTAFMTIGTLRLNGALIAVFSSLTVTFAAADAGRVLRVHGPDQGRWLLRSAHRLAGLVHRRGGRHQRHREAGGAAPVPPLLNRYTFGAPFDSARPEVRRA